MTSTNATARLRFIVSADGSVAGDDGADGLLASALRYSCRMAGQATGYLGFGQLVWIATLSSRAVTARTEEVEPGAFVITAEVAAHADTDAHQPSGRVTGIRGSLRDCLLGANLVLGTEWLAFMADDKRLIGATPAAGESDARREILQAVGERALAIVGTLDEEHLRTAITMTFEHGVLIVAPVDEHVVFGVADRIDAPVLSDVVDALRRSVRALDLRFAPMVPRQAAPVSVEAIEEYVAALPEQPVSWRRRRRERREEAQRAALAQAMAARRGTARKK